LYRIECTSPIAGNKVASLSLHDELAAWVPFLCGGKYQRSGCSSSSGWQSALLSFGTQSSMSGARSKTH
jgi:hypothetical protein